jgi:hypothetical protein
LKEKLGNEIHTKVSNLGDDHRNKSLVGQIVTPKINNTQGCETFKDSDFSNPSQKNQNKLTKNTKMILVERGGCSFYWKYKNAL